MGGGICEVGEVGRWEARSEEVGVREMGKRRHGMLRGKRGGCQIRTSTIAGLAMMLFLLLIRSQAPQDHVCL